MQDRETHQLLTAELIKTDSEVTVLRLEGEVDLSSAHVLSSQFETLEQEAPARVVIDATAITFMDSTGLHALIQGKQLIHDKGTRIVLVPSPQVRRVLELVFPEPLFAARLDSLEDAMRHFDQSPDPTPTV